MIANGAPSGTTANKAAQQAAGLRRIADLITAYPDLADWFDYTLQRSGINVFPCGDDERAALAWFVRAVKAAGATVTKEITASQYRVRADFDGVVVESLSCRENVCERVIVGTETVTRKVPDPSAPLVEVTETVEQVEWRCSPLLAPAVSA